MSYSILFVDSDITRLREIKREFFSNEFKIFFAESGEQALGILFENKIDILITETILPKTDGITLLKKIKSLYPSIIRIVCCQMLDQKTMNKIINSNLAKLIVNKPWEENELVNTVRDLIYINDKLNNEYIKHIIHSSNKLPTLPRIYNEICGLIDDETTNLDDIIHVINTDQVIASKILKVANSSFIGVKTGSVKTAVLNIGLLNLKSVIISSEVFKTEGSQYLDLLWKHSCLTNLMTISLYEYIFKTPIPDIYSSAGLLHDLGKVILYKVFERKYEKILTMKAENSELSLSVCENNIFHVTHEELGSTILSYWELPASIVETTLKHHEPEKASKQFKGITAIVHVADYYSWARYNDKLLPELKPEVFKVLGIERERIEELLKKI